MTFGIHYTRSGSRFQATTLRNVDLPNGHMSSQSAQEAAGLQPLDYSRNVESDYANYLDDSQSVTVYVNFLASGPVTWQSKTQALVALSTIAAEVQEVEMLTMVLEELGLPVLQRKIIREDIQPYQLFADHAGNFTSTKHIDFVGERIIKGSVRAYYIATTKKNAEHLHHGTGKGTLLQVQSIGSSVKINGQVQLEDTTTCKLSWLI